MGVVTIFHAYTDVMTQGMRIGTLHDLNDDARSIRIVVRFVSCCQFDTVRLRWQLPSQHRRTLSADNSIVRMLF